MKTKVTGILRVAMFLAGAAMAAQAEADGQFDRPIVDVRYRFDDIRLAGVEHVQVVERLKVTGWQVSRHVFVGRAKIADRNGFGLIIRNGRTVYGLNSRGFQVTRYF